MNVKALSISIYAPLEKKGRSTHRSTQKLQALRKKTKKQKQTNIYAPFKGKTASQHKEVCESCKHCKEQL
jgi:hypothetical protein